MGCNCNSIVIPKPNQMLKGIVGISKLLVGKNKADETMIQKRRDICRECEFATRDKALLDRPSKGLTAYSQCLKCACVLKYKTMLCEERCPVGKW